MSKLNSTITDIIMQLSGNAKLTWVGLLKEIKNSHPEIKTVIGTRPALMQDRYSITAKLYNGHKVIVNMTREEQPGYSWETAISL